VIDAIGKTALIPELKIPLSGANENQNFLFQPGIASDIVAL